MDIWDIKTGSLAQVFYSLVLLGKNLAVIFVEDGGDS